MTSRTYDQFCGIARALDLVGERWALLIVRDLVLGPKRFTDLRRGLEGIGTNVLAARLKELERGGVIQRRTLPPPAASTGDDRAPLRRRRVPRTDRRRLAPGRAGHARRRRPRPHDRGRDAHRLPGRRRRAGGRARAGGRRGATRAAAADLRLRRRRLTRLPPPNPRCGRA